ncbi:ABC transporter substrate-binding protein [Microlunatus parietis]|uniref:Multiple sugar transport system substrate-binding protein n=1 Tax=Microlunatus parietis TaxID=682979 RepID=A0A7Y9IAE1_9ACTN|nr:extracellular solute-binding protein [Microlunatus parietis]NYE73271.1 multiple sugar transport system substrate-binding protein [Microlunatus parietis]
MVTRTPPLRAFGAIALALVLSLVGAGCGRNSAGPAEDGRTTLRFAWWGNEKRAEATQQALRAFEAAHPGITVIGESTEFSAYFDKLATGVAAGDAPDVFTLGGAYPAEYAGRGALLDLASVSGSLDLDALDASARQNGQVRGAQYGVSTGANALAIVANPKVFAAAGVELPDDDTWTWDDYAALATAITEKSPKGTYGTATPLTHDSLDAYARQRGESLYTEDGKLGLTEQTVAAFFDYSLRLMKQQAAPPATITVEEEGASTEQTLMGRGQAGMMLAWSNSVSALGTATGTELKLLKLPGETPTPGIWLQSSQYYAISAKTEQADAAAKLINFLVNDERAASVLLTDRGVPANPEIRTAIADQLSPAGKVEVDYIDAIGKIEFAPTFIGPVGSTKVADITSRVSTDVLFERITPAEAAKQWLTESQQAIAG